MLLVQGTAFNWPEPNHFRIVTLPREDDLEMAINRFGRFLSTTVSNRFCCQRLPRKPFYLHPARTPQNIRSCYQQIAAGNVVYELLFAHLPV